MTGVNLVGRFLNVILMPTDRCDATCRYCFVHAGRGDMEFATVRRIFAQVRLYAIDRDIERIYFFWQGGEALLLGPNWSPVLAADAGSWVCVSADAPHRAAAR